MATLKDHQQAMVDLLASGSGIPASASRLAHAMHDVVDMLIAAFPNVPLSPDVPQGPKRPDATTPGLNDKALAADVEACRIKLTGAGGGPKATPAERRVKELENTVKQLREVSRACRDARIKELENTVNQLKDRVANLKADQAYWYGRCLDAGILDESQEQAGCRKDDTQVCEHSWVEETEYGTPTGVSICTQCGAAKL